MFIYNDINYVKYIFNLPYVEGRELYFKCLGRLNDIEIEKEENKQFKLFLFEVGQGNFEGSFEDYKKIKIIKIEDKKMSDKEIDKETKKILKKVSKIKEKDEKYKKNIKS